MRAVLIATLLAACVPLMRWQDKGLDIVHVSNRGAISVGQQVTDANRTYYATLTPVGECSKRISADETVPWPCGDEPKPTGCFGTLNGRDWPLQCELIARENLLAELSTLEDCKVEVALYNYERALWGEAPERLEYMQKVCSQKEGAK